MFPPINILDLPSSTVPVQTMQRGVAYGDAFSVTAEQESDYRGDGANMGNDQNRPIAMLAQDIFQGLGYVGSKSAVNGGTWGAVKASFVPLGLPLRLAMSGK